MGGDIMDKSSICHDLTLLYMSNMLSFINHKKPEDYAEEYLKASKSISKGLMHIYTPDLLNSLIDEYDMKL
jgi:hypothetical protein